MTEEIHTTCPYCGVGCGVTVNYDAQACTAIVRGTPEHPANLGRLCSKGAALGETLSLAGRALHPVIRGKQVEWAQALDAVAQKFARVIEEHGRDAVAFYVSGQLPTEDYYVANKLMKGFIGSANIDTNSRLCMSSAVAGQKRAFGSDSVPCSYEDLERTNLIVITGSNTAWCHPVIYQRIKKAKVNNPALQIVVIDPRRTATCEIADMHLAIRSGADALLFNGLLAYLHQHDEVNRPFVDYCTEGLEPALAMAQATATLAQVATGCDLTEQQVAAFYELFARKEKVVTLYSQGVNQSSSGTDKVNSIINCHLLSGRMGRPGMGPFSITGQPNAMGGREVGGLSNQLAAHMELGNVHHRHLVQSFWQSPVIADKPGYKAVELFDAVLDGKVKAIWIMATNPAVSLPNSNRVQQALSQCELVVVSDCVTTTDTTAFAHVLLPAAAWGERDGTVTNSERRMSRQRAFRDAPGEAKPDWWIVCEVAKRMARQLNWPAAFEYASPREIFDEYAALTGYNNFGTRDLDISALAGMDETAYQNLAPVQWPVNAAHIAGTPRMFEDGIFFTPSGKAQFVPVTPRAPVNTPDALFPLILNTGRVRDQWHTMTRTGRSARLSAHEPEPFLQLHTRDAANYAVSDGGLVTVSSRWGAALVRAKVSDDIKPGMVFMPIHWSNQFASSARADALVNPECDPYSGQPEFKHTPVNISASRKAWYGFLLSRRRFQMSLKGYWSMSLGEGLWRYELAGDELPQDWATHARELLCSKEDDVAWMEYFDRGTRRYRAGRMVGDRLESCIFIGPDHQLPNRDWLMKLFARERLSEQDKSFLLSGRPGEKGEDAGAAVCACFGVGRNTLLRLIQSGEVSTVAEIGKRLNAGTHCGSCIPELQALLAMSATKL